MKQAWPSAWKELKTGGPPGEVQLPGALEFTSNTVLVALGMFGLHILFHKVLSATSSQYNRIPQLLKEAEQRKQRQNSESNDNSVKNGDGRDKTATTPDYELPLMGVTAHVLTCQDLVVLPVAVAICVYYLRCVLSLSEGLQNRFFGYSQDFIYGAYLHAAFSIYEMIIYCIVGKKYVFYLHHVLVFLLYGSGVVMGTLYFYLAWAGLVEVTNVFLSSLSILGRMDLKSNPLYLSAGVGLYVSYVLSRLISLPAALGCLFYDAFTGPAPVVNQIRGFVVFGTAVCLVIISMSAFWFLKIHAGLMKHLYGEGGKEAGSEMDRLSHQNEHSNGHLKSQ
mmetsp:Transcript_11865/g.16431  ORF Transcript_11865/g.16431 Transcript_11865/m.16431 type:complete len:336 (+) Transcript_11865:2-1009(+)